MQTTTAGELIRVLTKKRNERNELAEKAKAKEADYLRKANGLVNRAAEMLKPLEPFDISAKVEEFSTQTDFGNGLVSVSLIMLRVLDGDNELLTIEPHIPQTHPSKPFFFAKYGAKRLPLVFQPAGQEPGWYFWTNEDDKSLEPSYLRLDEDSLMGLIKSIVE